MSNIQKKEVRDVIKDNMMGYAMSVILSRALPEIDGFKPSQRKVLYTMYKMGLFNTRAKSANIEGQVMKINPHAGCLTGDTKMYLLNGEIKTLKELVDINEQQWVLAINENGEIVPAIADNFRETKKVNELYEITFSNGFSIKATGNHKFRTVDGRWVSADNLSVGEIIDFCKINPDSLNKNRPKLFGFKTKSDLIQRIVASFVYGDIDSGYHVHHKDRNPLNNSPDNLMVMSASEHGKIHLEDGNSHEGGYAAREILFGDGQIAKENRIKNQYLAKELSKNYGLVRANAAINYLISNNIDVTYDNYVKYQKSEHNVTKVETLIKKGIIDSFEDLVRMNREGMSFIDYPYELRKPKNKGLGSKYGFSNKSEEHKKKCAEHFKRNGKIFSLIKTAIRHKFNHEYIKNLQVYSVVSEVPYVVSINVISVDSEPVFDFTVPTHQNALISVSDDDRLLACVHNSYSTMVRMTRERETLLTPFVWGKGSFGKHYSSDTVEAAPRYTEAQLAPICHELFDNLRKNPDNMIDNYDGTMKEPKYLSAPFPNILANPNMGIAVGFACNFPSFNLVELCDASIETIKNFDLDNKKLLPKILKKMPTVDFTTGGQILIDEEQLKSIYTEGQGAISIRAVFNDDSKNRILEVIEIPYTTTAETVVEDVIKAYKENRLPEIVDVRDEIDKEGFKIAIDYKRGTDVEELKKKLLALTHLQDNFNVNMNIVHQNRPQQMGVLDTLKIWVEHRREWVRIELTHDLQEKEDLLHLLEGLEKVLLDIDKAVKIVKDSKNDEEVIKGLKKTFGLDDIQAEYVAEIKLRNFNKDYILNKTKEIKNIKSEIKTLKETIKSGIDNKLINDLEKIKTKYGIPRKSDILVDYEELPTFRKNSKPEVKVDGNSIIFCNGDTIKRVNESSTAKTPKGFTKWTVANTTELLAFTSLGKVFKWNINKLTEGSNSKISEVKQIAKKLDVGESIIYTCPLIPENNLVIIFDNDKIIKFSLSAYVTSGLKLCFTKGFSDKSPVEYIRAISEDKEINLDIYKTAINTADYNLTNSRVGQGVKLKTKRKK